MSEYSITDWKGYISKLIDRSFQRQRNSGITKWIILTAMGYVFLTILSWKASGSGFDEQMLLLVLMKVLNIVLLTQSVYEIVKDELVADIASEIRIKPLCFRKTTNLESIIVLIYSSGAISINLYCSLYFYLKNGEYYLSQIFVTLFWIIIFLFSIPALAQNKRDFVYKSDLASKKTLSILIVSLVALGYFIGVIPIGVYNSSTVSYVKLALYIILFFQLGIFYIRHDRYDSEREFLEDIEKDIILKNLTSEEIMRIFVEEYWGETIGEVDLRWLRAESRFRDEAEGAKKAFLSLKTKFKSPEEKNNDCEQIKIKITKEYRGFSKEYKEILAILADFKDAECDWIIAKKQSERIRKYTEQTRIYKGFIKALLKWKRDNCELG